LMPLVVLEYVCDGSMFVPFWSCEDYSWLCNKSLMDSIVYSQLYLGLIERF
jgi:hypothetical protein